MASTHQNVFMRDDTFFGVCEALGQETRIPANLFRLALAPLLIWNPLATVIGYLVTGCVIALLRLIFPYPRGATATVEVVPVIAPVQVELAAPVLAKAA